MKENSRNIPLLLILQLLMKSFEKSVLIGSHKHFKTHGENAKWHHRKLKKESSATSARHISHHKKKVERQITMNVHNVKALRTVQNSEKYV